MSQAIERPDWMTEDLLIFEDAVTKFAEKELLPHNAKWEAAGQVPRAFALERAARREVERAGERDRRHAVVHLGGDLHEAGRER